jgi:hypothetical protein
VIEAGNESHDQAEPEVPAVEPAPHLPSYQAELPEVAAEGEADTAAGSASALPTMGEVRQLFAQLQVRREPSGKVVIEAPSEAASTLSALFEGMAAMLQAAAQDSK